MATKKTKARKAAGKAGKRKKRTAAKPAKAARRTTAAKPKRAAKAGPVEAEVGHVMNMLRAWSPARYSTR